MSGANGTERWRSEETIGGWCGIPSAFTAELVARAQAAGALRTDVTTEDVEALVGGAAIDAGPARWRQHLTIVLDGLRA